MSSPATGLQFARGVAALFLPLIVPLLHAADNEAMPGSITGAVPQAPQAQAVAAFSAQAPGGALAAPWRLQTYAKVPRHTSFSLIADGGATVLQVRAEQAAASLIRPFNADPAATPLLRWRWKPLASPQQTALGEKASDDWGARLYVLFEPPPESVSFGERLALGIARAIYGDDLPARGICYVWLPGGRVGAIAANAYTDRLKMIVVDAAPAGSWRAFERNLADDYRAAFGEALAPVSAIAVSADSDNSGGIAEVLIGDITIGTAPLRAAPDTAPPPR
ncbi:MAG TPA: DUF3047 domain-containing protein [Rhodocyclaceae bacterium]